ncbi:hypothetical protein B0H10DRAFT_2188772 [Mycena sp. CBHHK59/15]|nr:hypothetical protein B0H10DRAFT_2188772 [Mycena sp. CBHHK59/15]
MVKNVPREVLAEALAAVQLIAPRRCEAQCRRDKTHFLPVKRADAATYDGTLRTQTTTFGRRSLLPPSADTNYNERPGSADQTHSSSPHARRGHECAPRAACAVARDPAWAPCMRGQELGQRAGLRISASYVHRARLTPTRMGEPPCRRRSAQLALRSYRRHGCGFRR